MNNKTTHDQNELSIVDSLVQISYLIQTTLSRVGAGYDLSLIQIRLLGILRDREPSMLQLAKYLNLDKSSITGLVDRAQRRGLVERTASPGDRRGFLVKLTSEGAQLVQTAGQEIERQIHVLIEDLSEAERAQFITVAGKVLGASITSA